MRRFKARTYRTIDQSSMADVGFLLLIFFLVSTTIATDKGILVKLPPYDPDVPPALTSNRNYCKIHLNASNEIMIENEYSSISEIKPFVKKFIMNPNRNYMYAERPNKAVIAINNDRASLYGDYLALYNEVKGAYNELWNEKALTLFSKPLNQCTKEEKGKVKKMIPLVISEMEQ